MKRELQGGYSGYSQVLVGTQAGGDVLASSAETLEVATNSPASPDGDGAGVDATKSSACMRFDSRSCSVGGLRFLRTPLVKCRTDDDTTRFCAAVAK